jgi:hypothetical protein
MLDPPGGPGAHDATVNDAPLQLTRHAAHLQAVDRRVAAAPPPPWPAPHPPAAEAHVAHGRPRDEARPPNARPSSPAPSTPQTPPRAAPTATGRRHGGYPGDARSRAAPWDCEAPRSTRRASGAAASLRRSSSSVWTDWYPYPPSLYRGDGGGTSRSHPVCLGGYRSGYRSPGFGLFGRFYWYPYLVAAVGYRGTGRQRHSRPSWASSPSWSRLSWCWPSAMWRRRGAPFLRLPRSSIRPCSRSWLTALPM